MRCGRKGEAGIGHDVDNGSAEGTESPQQRGDGGQHITAVPDQRGDRTVRHSQCAEAEKDQVASQINLCRVLRGNGQHLERCRRGGDHLIGPFGAESFTPDVQRGGDGEEDSEHPMVQLSSIVH